MTRKTKREVEKDIEDLNDETSTDDDDPPTRGRDGVTADFIKFVDEDDAERADAEDREPTFIAFKENHVDDDEEGGDR